MPMALERVVVGEFFCMEIHIILGCKFMEKYLFSLQYAGGNQRGPSEHE